MKTKLWSLFLVFTLIVVTSSCTSVSTAIPSTPTPIQPTFTPIPPTFTPIPPTSTPEPTPTETPIIYNVEINVVDETAKPVPEAKIIQGDSIEYTDNLGIWSKSSQTPDFSLNIWAQGFLLQEHSSTLQSGEVTTQA